MVLDVTNAGDGMSATLGCTLLDYEFMSFLDLN